MAARASYHHGDLRRALLEAARELLEEAGAESVTLRATARRAGVSHAAPYHHFSDKAHLIEALAVDGFEAFADALRRAREATNGNPLERLRATGVAYVRFATEHPALFRLMNRPELRGRGRSASAEAGPVEVAARGAYRVLEEGIRSAQEAGLMEPGDATPHALAAWSLVHGLAVLAIDGLIDGRPTAPADGERLALMATEVLGRGLLPR